MTREEQEQCKTLEAVCDLKSELDILRYIKVVEKLRASSSLDVLRCMLWCLRDTDAGEVQYELVEACEAYPGDVYVRTFLDEGLGVEKTAPEWFGLMFQSILNSDSCREVAIRILNETDANRREEYKRIIRGIIADDAPQYLAVLDQLS